MIKAVGEETWMKSQNKIQDSFFLNVTETCNDATPNQLHNQYDQVTIKPKSK